jgi:hypothetical protein
MSVKDTMANIAFIALPVTMAVGGLAMFLFGNRRQSGGGQSGGARRTLRMRRTRRNGTRRA